MFRTLTHFFFVFQTDRRTQTHHSEFVSGSRSCSPAPSSALHDPEAVYPEEDDFGQEWQSRLSRGQSRRRTLEDDALLQNVEWDDDLSPEPSSQPRHYDLRCDIPRHILPLESEDEDFGLLTSRPNFGSTERTPLLIRPPSRVSLARPTAEDPQNLVIPYAAIQRKISFSSVLSKTSNKVKYQYGGQSTFAQTVRTGNILYAYSRRELIWLLCSFSMPSAYSSVSVCSPSLSHLPVRDGSGVPSLSLGMVSCPVTRKSTHISHNGTTLTALIAPRSLPV